MKIVLLFAAWLCSFNVMAGPAPWYKWRSPVNDYFICSQTPPGDGWVIFKGPFQDAHCSKAGVP